MIHIDGLTRRYGATTVVDTVTLRVQQGELLALVGGSGAGKTTLLKMINRLIEPTSGCVRLGGEDTRSVEPHTLRRRSEWRDVRAALGELDGRIPVERMRASNLAVDGQGRSPSVVAQDLLSALRLRGADPAPAR